jgi:hypothetical protein
MFGLEITRDIDLFSPGVIGTARARHAEMARGQAMAYIWGRQDAGESARDTGYSGVFGAVYAVADYLTNGYADSIQSAYHEWHATGRLLVRIPERGAYVEVTGVENLGVHVHLVPFAGREEYWPGIVREPQEVV